MEANNDVAIVSAFGRGNWLASELADLGLQVTLIDVSERLGRWTPEDWEGPFGFFKAEFLRDSQIARLIEEDYYDSVDEGFTVWLPQGPIDLKGPLSSYFLEKYGLRGAVEEYLLSYDSHTLDRREELIAEIERIGFSRSWLVHLAHQMACHVYEPNAEAINYGRPLPIFSSYFVRRVSRRGYEKSLEWLKSKNVQVLDHASLKDLWVNGNHVEGLEIQSSWSGALKAQNIVWTLTSEETAMFPERIGEFLFPDGAIQSLWSWVRYRLQLNKGLHVETLPIKFVLIQDLSLPWTHANLCLVQRSVSDLDLDVWIRIPTQHRFQRSYLQDMGDRIVKLFDAKIPDGRAKILNMPQDFLYEYVELGPPRFPVFARKDLSKLARNQFKNFYFDGPEMWELLDWTGQFRHQLIIFERIREWKEKRERQMRQQMHDRGAL